MQGSGFGEIFNIKTFGESHGKALGVIVDGVPAGLPLTEDDINVFMDKRKPGQSKYTTQRKESDSIKILSGVFEDHTTGCPIMLMVENEDQKSRDYSDIAEIYRPGHADFTYHDKYRIRDYRGGGRSSGRETIGRVAAGAIAIKALKYLGIDLVTYTESIGSVRCENIDFKSIEENDLRMADNEAAKKAAALLDKAREDKDSMGGVVKCIAMGVMPGLGDPVFNKLDANLAHAIMSIGAVKAVEIGDGVLVSEYYGSYNNDEFFAEDGRVMKDTNHSGGILGGISDGSDIIIKAHFKPTPSIAKKQNTIDIYDENREIEIKGRHDPVIVPRAVVVVEAMTAIVLFDAVLKNMTSRMQDIISFYEK